MAVGKVSHGGKIKVVNFFTIPHCFGNLEMKYFIGIFLGYFYGFIFTSGVHDNNFIYHVFNRFQTLRELLPFIPHNHG